jgi:hypothetical protein
MKATGIMKRVSKARPIAESILTFFLNQTINPEGESQGQGYPGNMSIICCHYYNTVAAKLNSRIARYSAFSFKKKRPSTTLTRGLM